MNPLPHSGRETGNGSYRLIFRVSIFIMALAVILSWFLARPAGSPSYGLPVMAIWFLIVIIVVGTIFLMWRYSSARVSRTVAMIAAGVTVLGMIAAFLSGDKFDTIRAAIVSGLMLIINFTGRKYSREQEF